jgi:hypothetical protein
MEMVKLNNDKTRIGSGILGISNDVVSILNVLQISHNNVKISTGGNLVHHKFN